MATKKQIKQRVTKLHGDLKIILQQHTMAELSYDGKDADFAEYVKDLLPAISKLTVTLEIIMDCP
jgi:hypothetical protein